jgi:hypothetical protein
MQKLKKTPTRQGEEAVYGCLSFICTGLRSPHLASAAFLAISLLNPLTPVTLPPLRPRLAMYSLTAFEGFVFMQTNHALTDKACQRIFLFILRDLISL